MQAQKGDILGPVKIKDGLFIGDELAAQDLEFVVTNKVSHIVNCARKQIQNHWETIGIAYLSLNWMETDYQILFDAKDELLNEVYRFIETAMAKGESVLVHSVKGQNRSCCLLAAYLMKKYRWSLYKTLEYLHSRKSNLEIRANFFTQLTSLEARLAKLGQGPKTQTWNEVGEGATNIDSEELLLTNTFLNTRIPEPNDVKEGVQKKEITSKVSFSEQNHIQHHPKEKKFANMFSIGANKKEPVENTQTKTAIKSILKGSNKVFELRPKTEEGKSSQVGFNEGFSNNEKNGFSKKQVEMDAPKENSGSELPRPNSSKGLNIRPFSGKSGLPPVKDSQLELSETNKGVGGAPNIQNINGNIIHITVNNYIANANLPAENGQHSVQGNLNKRLALPEEKRLNRLGVSNSSKELFSNKAFVKTRDRDDKLPGKRGISPLSNFEKKSTGNFNKGFASASILENPKKFASNSSFNDEYFQNSTFKRVSATDKSSLIVIGNQNLSKTLGLPMDRKNDSNSFRSMNVTQNLDQDWGSIGANNNLSTKSNQGEYKTPNYYKYLNPGQSGPVKPTQGFGSKGQSFPEKEDSSQHLYYEPKPSITNLKDKQIPRPTTAPDQKFAFTLKNSPYLPATTNTAASKIQTRKGRTIEATHEPRQSSVQPSKDNAMMSDGFNPRLRSISPGQAKTNLFNHFQEISNKPRWRF